MCLILNIYQHLSTELAFSKRFFMPLGLMHMHVDRHLVALNNRNHIRVSLLIVWLPIITLTMHSIASRLAKTKSHDYSWPTGWHGTTRVVPDGPCLTVLCAWPSAQARARGPFFVSCRPAKHDTMSVSGQPISTLGKKHLSQQIRNSQLS
jgi:hypothetical protein